MKRRIFNRHQAFAAVLGVTDGVLTSLTLAAGRMIHPQNRLSGSIAVRVAIASALAGGIVFFTAEVARRNYELVHAERQLNLISRGYLATTRLGHFVLVESLEAAVIVMASNFLGALAPLLAGSIFKQYAWMPIGLAIILLGALGVSIAQVTHRGRILWATSLMVVGTTLALLGIWLHIV